MSRRQRPLLVKAADGTPRSAHSALRLNLGRLASCQRFLITARPPRAQATRQGSSKVVFHNKQNSRHTLRQDVPKFLARMKQPRFDGIFWALADFCDLG